MDFPAPLRHAISELAVACYDIGVTTGELMANCRNNNLGDSGCRVLAKMAVGED